MRSYPAAALAGALTVAMLGGASWAGSPAAAITLDGPVATLTVPATAGPGELVNAGGQGWQAAAACSIEWDGAPLPSDCAIDDKGALAASFTVPEDAAEVQHTVTASAGDVTRRAVVQVARTVTVPNVRGLTRGDLLIAMKEAGLSDCGSISGDGVVVSQDPAAGDRVPSMTCLAATLAPVVTVPDLTGDSVDQAAAALERSGLALVSPSTDDGAVTGQDPAAGNSVPAGTPVRVTLAALPPADLVVVPNLLRHMTVADARVAVAQVGLRLRGGHRLLRRLVAGQSPLPGTTARPGDIVRITLGAPPVRLVAVPDLTGLRVSAAAERLRRLDLTLGGAPDPAALVTGQAPGAGTPVPPGSSIAVTVAVTAAPAGGTGSGDGFPGALAAIGGGLAVVLAGGGWLLRGRVRRAPRPKPSGPVLLPRPDLAAEPESDEDPAWPPVRLVPHPDPDGQLEDEEVPV